MLGACDLVAEVGLKLGQTLWRKVIPGELEDADKDLTLSIYQALVDEDWARAETFAEFELNLPKVSSDLHRKVSMINYVIALKFSGAADRAMAVLEKTDWSSSALDFRLAESVLSVRNDAAAQTMRTIGRSGVLVDEAAYHTWPLFREFRGTEEFRAAYEEIYGHAFVAELRGTADAITREAGTASLAEARSEPSEGTVK